LRYDDHHHNHGEAMNQLSRVPLAIDRIDASMLIRLSLEQIDLYGSVTLGQVQAEIFMQARPGSRKEATGNPKLFRLSPQRTNG
jgi:hypothetical protein